MSAWFYVLAALLIAIGVLYLVERGNANEYELRVRNLEDVVVPELMQRADSADSLALEYQRLADSITVVTVTTVDTLHMEVERVRLVEVPDTCRQLVLARDSLIDRYDGAVRSWRAAYDRQIAANVALRVTVTTLRTAVDSVSTALAARPKPRSRWLPRIVVGPSAGYCADLGTCTGVMVTAGWEINLERLLPWD